MKKTNKFQKIGVGKLMNYLFGQPYYFVNSEWLEKGRWVHNRLGYTNTQCFSKYFANYFIIGCPDWIEEGIILELKTFSCSKSQKYQIAKGECQANIYCYLSGTIKYRIDLFDTKSQKLTLGKIKEASYKQAEADIRRALEIKRRIDEVIKGGS